MATLVRMPEVLTGITEAAIQTWLVEEGQTVAVGTPIAEVETEKAVVEYAAETEGTVLKLIAAAGASVAIGDPIAVIGAAGESVEDVESAPTVVAAPTPDPAPDGGSAAVGAGVAAEAHGASALSSSAPTVVAAPTPVSSEGDASARQFVSPLVRRLAKERGIDLAGVTGTGPNGRIVRRDLDADRSLSERSESKGAAATDTGATSRVSGADTRNIAPVATADGVEAIPLTGMRRAIARRLTESKTTVPHFYLVADCRVDALFALRKQVNESQSVKVSVNDFVLKAVAGALRDVPEANSTWGETVINRHSAVDIAVAVAIDNGLVTPVLRDVDRMPITEISRTVGDLAERARAGRLKQHELEGGTFSVSNLGMYGITEFSAIINPPHAGILAVGAARPMPIVEDGALAIGTVMTVTLSADHRVVDGAVGAQWLAAFQKRIESPLSMLV
jgi:pyruvate dehydrogenase E2 component (dihydrolipoamide acetyltransferase)